MASHADEQIAMHFFQSPLSSSWGWQAFEWDCCFCRLGVAWQCRVVLKKQSNLAWIVLQRHVSRPMQLDICKHTLLVCLKCCIFTLHLELHSYNIQSHGVYAAVYLLCLLSALISDQTFQTKHQTCIVCERECTKWKATHVPTTCLTQDSLDCNVNITTLNVI